MREQGWAREANARARRDCCLCGRRCLTVTRSLCLTQHTSTCYSPVHHRPSSTREIPSRRTPPPVIVELSCQGSRFVSEKVAQCGRETTQQGRQHLMLSPTQDYIRHRVVRGSSPSRHHNDPRHRGMREFEANREPRTCTSSGGAMDTQTISTCAEASF